MLNGPAVPLNEKDKRGRTPLHHAVLNKDLAKVKMLIEQRADVEAYENNHLNPLAFAVVKKDKSLIDVLLKAGANPYACVLDFQTNIVMLARADGIEDTPCSRYLEKRLLLEEGYLNRIAKEFSAMLQQQMNIAKEARKKVLVILGESHGHYKIEQVEKLMIRIAKRLGIEAAFAELPKDSPTDYIRPFYFAKNTMRMKVIAIDDHPQRNNDATILERSIVMAKRIKELNKSAVLITGSYHLQHFVMRQNSQIDRNQFHIIPINLGPLSGENCLEDPDDQVEGQFSINPKQVIQIDAMGMSDYEAVLSALNGEPIKFLLPILYEAIKDSPEKIKMFDSLRHEKETIEILKKFDSRLCVKLNILLNNNADKFRSFAPRLRQRYLKFYLKKWTTPVSDSASMFEPWASDVAPIIHSYHATKRPVSVSADEARCDHIVIDMGF